MTQVETGLSQDQYAGVNRVLCSEKIRVLYCVFADINECENETTNNCIADFELCINSIGSYDCCNASELLCQQRAGNTILTLHYCSCLLLCHTGGFPSSSDDELTSIERTSLIIGGILVFLIAILIAITIIIVVYIYMFSPRELYAKLSNNCILNLVTAVC